MSKFCSRISKQSTVNCVQLSACFSKGDDVLEDGFAATTGGGGACSPFSDEPFVAVLI